jgi:hypothetical protein
MPDQSDRICNSSISKHRLSLREQAVIEVGDLQQCRDDTPDLPRRSCENHSKSERFPAATAKVAILRARG